MIKRDPVRFVIIIPVLMAGCSSGFGPKSIDSPDPSAKIPAIKQAADDHDMSHVAQMVKDLDSDDPAVRFYAIEGLERLTGDTFGYVYYQDDDQRAVAVKKWNEWLSAREGKPVTSPSAASDGQRQPGV